MGRLAAGSQGKGNSSGHFYPVLWIFLSCVMGISILCCGHFCPVLQIFLSCVVDISILCYGRLYPVLWTFLSSVMDISVLCYGHFCPVLWTFLSPVISNSPKLGQSVLIKRCKRYTCHTCMEVKSEDAKHSITAPEAKAEYRYKKDAENINGI